MKPSVASLETAAALSQSSLRDVLIADPEYGARELARVLDASKADLVAALQELARVVDSVYPDTPALKAARAALERHREGA